MPYKQKGDNAFTYIAAILVSSLSSTLAAQEFTQDINAAHDKRPNIVMIVTDDQHRIDFNFLPEGRGKDGQPLNLSPNIDKIANEGIIFNNMYATSSVCTPSRFSVLTGQLASRATSHRFASDLQQFKQANVSFNTHILPENDSLPKILKQGGYFTGGVGKNHVFEGEILHKLKKNADVTSPSIIRKLTENQNAQIKAYHDNGFDYAARIYTGNVPGQYPKGLEAHNQDWITEGAIEFLSQAEQKQQPFFLYFATTLEHGPHKQGSKYKGSPHMTPIGLLSDKDLPKVQPSRESISHRIKSAGLKQRATDVLWLDDAVGALLTKLETMGELDNTIILYFTDHGVEGGKGSLYQGGTLAPSFIWAANLSKAGTRLDNIVANIDFAPTIYDFANITNPPKTDGMSFRKLLTEPSDDWRQSLTSEIGMTRSIIRDGWKYIAFRVPEGKKNLSAKERKKKALSQRHNRSVTDFDSLPWMHMGGIPGGRGLERLVVKTYGKENYFASDQLYHVAKDPKEKINLIDDEKYANILENLKKEMTIELKQRVGTFEEFTQ